MPDHLGEKEVPDQGDQREEAGGRTGEEVLEKDKGEGTEALVEVAKDILDVLGKIKVSSTTIGNV